MAHRNGSLNRTRKLQQLHVIFTIVRVVMMMYMMWYMKSVALIRRISLREGKKPNKLLRYKMLNRLIRENDTICRNELRVDRHVFSVLCEMLRDVGGLKATRNMSIEEIVAMFMYTLAHHKKNRSISHYFIRSGESVSRQFNHCLRAVLSLHERLLKRPTPISEDCEDNRWNCFKNCLGALDGTYIGVSLRSQDKARYRTRKGTVSMNVLGACTPNMEFTYVLTGWEGSAHDGRVLRNAISRPDGLRVPKGCYYLVDGGYANCEGFLAPYRGQRCHLKEWGNKQPSSAEEYFNMKHARARNVIERCFGVLKGRWAILRSPSFFPIRTQSRIVLACCLLHNLIRRLTPTDQAEGFMNEEDEDEDEEDDQEEEDEEETEFITYIQTSDHWTNFRNTLAQDLFNRWRSRHV